MGRPSKDIDAEMVRKLAQMGCTQSDVADYFACARSVISERFRRDFDPRQVSVENLAPPPSMEGRPRRFGPYAHPPR